MTKTEIREVLLLIGDMRADREFVYSHGNVENRAKADKMYHEAVELATDGLYRALNQPFEDQLRANLGKVWGFK